MDVKLLIKIQSRFIADGFALLTLPTKAKTSIDEGVLKSFYFSTQFVIETIPPQYSDEKPFASE